MKMLQRYKGEKSDCVLKVDLLEVSQKVHLLRKEANTIIFHA